MLKAIFSALKVKPEEEGQVILLSGMGFFIGIFLASYQVGSETIFLSRLQDKLELAFLAAGILGVLSTALFSYAQSRIKFSTLVVINMILICLFVIGVYSTFNFLDIIYQDYVAFVMFAMIGPITAVLLLSFWGVFGRLFNLRQSKRIIGWIDSGQLLAAIMAFFVIPLSWNLIGDTDNIFLISSLSILISAGFLIFLVSRYDLIYGEQLSKQLSPEKRKSLKLNNLLKDRYVQILSGFLLFSMMSFIIVQYGFQNAISKQYPTEEQLGNFISFFRGFSLIFMFFLQTFVNDRILSEYGIKIALLILPVVLAIFTGLAIAAGYLFGYTPEDGIFIYYLIAIAISHLFGYSLRDALENPTFKLYFMPLDNDIRFNIQTKVEGIANEFSRLIAGLIIFGLSSLPFIETIHYSFVVVLLIMGYMYLVGKLYAEYRNKIKLKLESQGGDVGVVSDVQTIIEKLTETLNDNRARKAIFSFKLLEKIDPKLTGGNVNKMMNHAADRVRDYAQLRINEINGLSVSENYVVSYANAKKPEGKKVLTYNELMELFEYGDITQRRILSLSKSADSSDRLYAAELILNAAGNEYCSLLIELLNDEDYNVRVASIKVAQKKFDNEVIYSIINNLASPVYTNLAADSLVVIGVKGLNALDAAFFKSGQSTAIMIKIIQIMGRIGDNKAKSLLWAKLDYPDKIILSQVLLALGQSNFKAGISQITQIKYAIESDIEDIAWNIAATTEISEAHIGEKIIEALKEENEYDIEHIYMLLGMLYDPYSIQLVKENIETGTVESISFAIELLDVFLSDDLKQKIIPLIDDISESEKAKKLEIFFPRLRLDDKLVLKYLINRDFNQTNRWTKSCVIYQIGLMKLEDYAMDIIANLFNPDLIILEVSAWSLNNISTSLYSENIKRLPDSSVVHLDNIIKNKKNHLMKFNKVNFLKKMTIFNEVHGLILTELVDMFDVIELKNQDYIQIENQNNDYFYIVYEGRVSINDGNFKLSIFERGTFINEISIVESGASTCVLKAEDDSILLRIFKDQFYDFLADHTKLAFSIVENV